MKLKPDQIARLGDERADACCRQLALRVETRHPAVFAAHAPDALLTRLRAEVDEARGHGLLTRGQMERWADPACILGFGFGAGRPWAAQLLASDRAPGQKLGLLEETAAFAARGGLSMAISMPLDGTACAQADDALCCANHDEPSLFDGQGGRAPLSASDPDQQHLRDLWCERYEDILAHNRDGSRPFPDRGFGHAHHPVDCAHCLGTAPPGDAPSLAPPPDDPSIDPVSPVEDCPYDDQLPLEPMIRIRASMFLDGTGDNRDNVTAGPGASGSDSHASGCSNVALLEWAQIEKGRGSDRAHLDPCGGHGRHRRRRGRP